jgi:hypothetical protein
LQEQQQSASIQALTKWHQKSIKRCIGKAIVLFGSTMIAIAGADAQTVTSQPDDRYTLGPD